MPAAYRFMYFLFCIDIDFKGTLLPSKNDMA